MDSNNIRNNIKDEIWRPSCPKCNKLMSGGIGVVRLENYDTDKYSHPYFCAECADELLGSNTGVIIAPGCEKNYEKYKNSQNNINMTEKNI